MEKPAAKQPTFSEEFLPVGKWTVRFRLRVGEVVLYCTVLFHTLIGLQSKLVDFFLTELKFSSVVFSMVSVRSEKHIRAPPRLSVSEVSPTLRLKGFQCSSVCFRFFCCFGGCCCFPYSALQFSVRVYMYVCPVKSPMRDHCV